MHSAYTPGATETVLYATFFEVAKEGPLTIPAPTPDSAQWPRPLRARAADRASA